MLFTLGNLVADASHKGNVGPADGGNVMGGSSGTSSKTLVVTTRRYASNSSCNWFSGGNEPWSGDSGKFQCGEHFSRRYL